MLTACNGCHVGFKHITSHLARSSACKAAYSFGFGGGGLVQHEQPHPVLLEHKRRERAALVGKGLGDLRFEKGLGDSVIEPIKAFAAECNRPAKAGATAELCALHPALSPSAVAEILDLHFDHFNGLRTEKQEFAHYRATVPTVPVVEREVGDGHVVCDIPLLDNLERFLSNSPDEIVDKIIDTSTRLKAGMYLKDTGVIEDVFHGTVIKEHPAGQPSTDVKELRILVGGYTDGCEMANGMGPAAGEHELWCTSACILNLPPGERYEHDNLLLMNVATNKAVGNATMTTIFSGADPTTGKVLVGHSSSPGAQLREHRRTISFIRHSVRVTFNMVVWMLFFSADNPAAGKMTSFPESTSAHLFCRGCLGDLREDDVKQPHDFFECAAGRCSFTAGRRRKNKVCGLKLRTPAITKASKKEILAAPNKTATQKLKSNKGISTIFPALSGELIPDFDEHTMVPFVRCILTLTLSPSPPPLLLPSPPPPPHRLHLLTHELTWLGHATPCVGSDARRGLAGHAVLRGVLRLQPLDQERPHDVGDVQRGVMTHSSPHSTLTPLPTSLPACCPP